ncbi:hypothetical protein, partial [Salmonella sp. s58953]|uniref:hypothetical protein n=1 Tax=Salmonella sp. s58953 TaxID=3159711 RepID=UPI00397F8CBA
MASALLASNALVAVAATATLNSFIEALTASFLAEAAETLVTILGPEVDFRPVNGKMVTAAEDGMAIAKSILVMLIVFLCFFLLLELKSGKEE